MLGTVLLIEKDESVAGELQLALVQEGLVVERTVPGLGALRKLLASNPHIVILGVGLEEEDWQFCTRLVTFLEQPLLLLVSSSDKLDRVRGLEYGADDCLIKPYLTAEVVARVRALLRRSRSWMPESERSYFIDDRLVVDLSRAEVWLDGQPVELTPTEFRFLGLFARHTGEVLSHERLALQVWGENYPGARAAIKQYVHQLRQKLEETPSDPQRILTRWGQGYVFKPLGGK